MQQLKKLAWKPFGLLPLALRRRIQYVLTFHTVPRFLKPRTFNEKVNWRILYDRRELLAWTCDKLQMKGNARELAPGLPAPSTLWSGQSIDELRSYEFPARWILKANHRSQCVFIGEGAPDWEELTAQTTKWMDPIQAKQLGEWAYSKAGALFILEEWIGTDDQAPEDYKFFVFDGKVHLIQVDEARFSRHAVAFYDRSWKRLEIQKTKIASGDTSDKPLALEKMIQFAEQIGRPFDFMRVDLFSTPSGIYFGETTPYPGGGLSPFSPKPVERWLGNLWKLPSV